MAYVPLFIIHSIALHHQKQNFLSLLKQNQGELYLLPTDQSGRNDLPLKLGQKDPPLK